MTHHFQLGILNINEQKNNKTSVYGDIIHLNLLTNLIEIDLSHTDVSGDIIHLKSLHNLTDIHRSTNKI